MNKQNKKPVSPIVAFGILFCVLGGIYLADMLHKDYKAKQAEQRRVAFEEEKKLKPVDNGEMITVNGVSFNMIKVQGGTFTMGNQDLESLKNAIWGMTWGELDSYHLQDVTLNDFYIGQTEVTCELWEAVMGDFPIKELTSGTLAAIEKRNKLIASRYKLGENYPIRYVNYYDILAFIEKLNNLTGKKFRLPTEAEWEFAAQGGNSSKGYMFSGSNIIDHVGWFSNNTHKDHDYPHPVMKLAPNELGIYDMSGNVREVCADIFNWRKRGILGLKYMNCKGTEGLKFLLRLPAVSNPLNKEKIKIRGDVNDVHYFDWKELNVARGGSYRFGALKANIRERSYFYYNTNKKDDDEFRDKDVGFRLAL